MTSHPLRQIVEACDRAITAKNYDALMEHYAEDAALVVKPGMTVKGKENIRSAFIAIANYFQDRLVVEQGEMQVIEGGECPRYHGNRSALSRWPGRNCGNVAPRDLCF